MMVTNTDICILGGGLAGATLAAAISQNTNHSCLVVEARAQDDLLQPDVTQSDQRNLVLTYQSIRLLQQWRVLPDLLEQLRLIKQVQVRAAQNSVIPASVLSLHHSDVHLPYLGGVFPAHQFIKAIHQQLHQSDHCTCQYQTRAESVHMDTRGLPSVRLNTGNIVRCKLLMIAEGAQAKSATQLNMHYKQQNYGQKVCVFHLRIQDMKDAWGDRSLWHQDPYQALWYQIADGSVALVPGYQSSANTSTNTDTGVLDYGCILTLNDTAADQWIAAPEAEQLRTLTSFLTLPDHMRIIQKGRVVAYPLTIGTASELARPGVLLMGNSAANLPPLGAQSLNLHFRLSDLLIKKLIQQQTLPLTWSALSDLSATMRQEIDHISQVLGYSLDYLHYSAKHPLLSRCSNLGLQWLNRTKPLKTMLIRRALGI